MQALGFVPGAGLYGVSDNFLYLINDSTGATTPVGATGLLDLTKAITDLAYDSATGRLIASAGCSKFDAFTQFACDESHQGSIYLIDRATGHATLLNGNAPMIVGLAEVVPEPSSALLFALGLGALLVRSALTLISQHSINGGDGRILNRRGNASPLHDIRRL